MRRFFYDTEFIEYINYSDVPTIDLISIGFVSEDEDAQEEFYAISSEFNIHSAVKSDFLRQNVLGQLPPKNEWKPRLNIKEEILDFLKPTKEDPVQLWGYYADYDHVALCWLFGRMIDLPKGMPMYTMDLKQLAVHLGNPRLPKQKSGEHDALADARWNRDVFFFLQDHAEVTGYNLEI
jgi:hypothetical protein